MNFKAHALITTLLPDSTATAEQSDATTSQAVTPTKPVTTDTPSLSPLQCKTSCPTCSSSTLLASLLTAIITALLATAIFLPVLVLVCKHFLRRIDIERRRASPLNATNRIYDQILLERSNPCTAEQDDTDNHTYMEVVGLRNVKEKFQVMDNQAYGTHKASTWQ